MKRFDLKEFKWNLRNYISDLTSIPFEFLELLPCKTRWDKKIITIKSSSKRFVKPLKLYIENPKFTVDSEIFPFFNIRYDAWTLKVKKRNEFNRYCTVYLTDIKRI